MRKLEKDVAGASQSHHNKLHTSCDVLATLNHLNTTVVDGARSIFAPTVILCPDQKHFPKMGIRMIKIEGSTSLLYPRSDFKALINIFFFYRRVAGTVKERVTKHEHDQLLLLRR